MSLIDRPLFRSHAWLHAVRPDGVDGEYFERDPVLVARGLMVSSDA